jgi:hypothetical protein
MASGDTLCSFQANSSFPPAANYALFTTRGSTYPIPLLNYTTSAVATALFLAQMPQHYAGGGVSFNIAWSCDTATSGTVGWLVGFSRLNAGNQDLDSISFSAAQTVVAITTSTTAGIVTTSSLNISSGTNMNSVTTGDWFVMSVSNNTASSTATGYSQFLGAELREL